MLGTCAGLLVLVGVVMRPLAKLHKAHHGTFLGRCIGFFALTLCMAFSWTFLLVSRWATSTLFGIKDPVFFKICVAVTMCVTGRYEQVVEWEGVLRRSCGVVLRRSVTGRSGEQSNQ